MGWVLRLVETGVDGSSRSVDVMAIDRLGDLGDIADLGLTRASSLWLWSNRKSSQPRAGTMRSDGRTAEFAPPPARSRITALTGSPPCSVRSCSGCPASAAPAVASGIPSFLGMGEVDPDVWHLKYCSTEAAM